MTTEVRIYVSCLAAYNSGVLHGEWIDAAQDADDLLEEIEEMLSESPQPSAEEWAIHDYEGFGSIKIGEHESLEDVSKIANLIEAHGDAAIAYLEHMGTDNIDPDHFGNAYRGEAKSEAEYAENWYRDANGEDSLGPLEHYIDWERFARDLFINDFYGHEVNGTIYVFDRNV